ncbi:MAG: hypothetical protein PHE27_02405 [Alphaproteobacteria bacterium]|nr:hypothetical protein [Alphaproteobacteria bacterium]
MTNSDAYENNGRKYSFSAEDLDRIGSIAARLMNNGQNSVAAWPVERKDEIGRIAGVEAQLELSSKFLTMCKLKEEYARWDSKIDPIHIRIEGLKAVDSYVSFLEKGGVSRKERIALFHFDEKTVQKKDIKILNKIGCKNLSELFDLRYNNQEKGLEIPKLSRFFKYDGFDMK